MLRIALMSMLVGAAAITAARAAYRPPPLLGRASTPATAPTTSPAQSIATIDTSIKHGLLFLVGRQQPDGSWPAVAPENKVLVTAVTLVALVESRAIVAPDQPPVPRDAQLRVRRQATAALAFAATDDDPAIPGGDYRRAHAHACALNVCGQVPGENAAASSADPAAALAAHQWRLEAAARLARAQHPDGSWGGNDDRTEPDPVLATAYAILAMTEIRRGLH